MREYTVMYCHNKKLTPNAKILRKNMTAEERRLWYGFLRTYRPRFLRQKVIGNYIVDFYCAEAKLVVELDGSQHFEETGIENDLKRDGFLSGLGCEVVRIPNNDVNRSFSAVSAYIDAAVRARLDTKL